MGFPFSGHGVPVQDGADGRWGTRGVDQDGADRTAIEGPAINRHQHADPVDRIHPKGQGQEDRDPDHGADPRKYADHDAQGHAEEEDQDELDVEYRPPTCCKVCEHNLILLLEQAPGREIDVEYVTEEIIGRKGDDRGNQDECPDPAHAQ